MKKSRNEWFDHMFDHLRKKAKSRRSAVGSALRSGRKGRGFESRRLDQNKAFMQKNNA